jgi:uncharacterized damage-inducible protein DinB
VIGKPHVFTLSGIRKLHSWTHSSLSLVLDHLSTLPKDDYAQKLTGFGFPTLREQIVHILNCEAFWIHILQNVPFENRDPADWPDVSSARVLQSKVIADTFAYLSDLTDEKLNADAELHFADGDTAVRAPALILHHIFTHAFHHKGQIVSMCRALGHPAPDTDLNQFA